MWQDVYREVASSAQCNPPCYCLRCVFVCVLQLRQQAVALQKAAAASEGVQEELRRQLDLGKQQCRELQKQLDAQMQDSNTTLGQAQQRQQELQQQLSEVARKHTQEVQQHRYGFFQCLGRHTQLCWCCVLPSFVSTAHPTVVLILHGGNHQDWDACCLVCCPICCA